VIYGRNAVREALAAGRRTVHRVWATSGAASESWIAAAGVPVDLAAADEIARRSGVSDHQGVCADVAAYPYVSADILLGGPAPLIVALDEIQDPQNLGSICRTAECAGAAGVVICERRAARVTPAVGKASAGAIEHLAIAPVRNLADFLAMGKASGCWCYGAAADGRPGYAETDFAGGVILVLGAEGRGLRPRVADACDALIALPLHGRIESLNVGAAAAALLYGILQSRADA